MTQTVISSSNAMTNKKWSASLFKDTLSKSYFSRKFIGTGENSVIQRKTELDSDQGDLISFDLSVQLRGRPTTGDAKLKGKEENLRFFTDQVYIDQTRKSVSAGGKMTRKRTKHDLRSIAKERLGDYWAKYMDEMVFIYLSGARGINQDYYEATDWTGHANNAIQAPDAQHIIYGGDAVSKATVEAADKMSRTLIERAAVKARMMRSLDPNAANMLPVTINGEAHYVMVMSPFQEHDLRVGDTTGWLEIQKAATTAEGKANPIFKGGLGMVNNIVLHSHESVVRFSDYGSGVNLPAARALMLGRQAGVIAYGNAGGLHYTWKEETDDYDNEMSVAAGTIVGMKKARFNDRDFGSIAVDTYSVDPG